MSVLFVLCQNAVCSVLIPQFRFQAIHLKDQSSDSTDQILDYTVQL